MSEKSMISRVMFSVDSQTKAEFDDITEVFDPELTIRLSDGSMISVFGDEEDLLQFANLLQETIQTKLKSREGKPWKRYGEE